MKTDPEIAAEAFFYQYHQLAIDIARLLTPRLPSFDIDDVVMSAMSRVWEELKKHDERRQPRDLFIRHRLRGRIIDAVRHLSRVPRDTVERLNEIKRKKRLSKRDGRLLERMSISFAGSFDAPFCDKNGVEMPGKSAIYPDIDADSPFEVCSRKDLCAFAVEHLRSRDKRKLQVITRYYLQGESQAEIGKAMGRTESWACQIRLDALADLREALSQIEPA